MNNSLSGLYAITDPLLLPGEKLVTAVEQALQGGASIIQYRDKTATEVELIRRAEALACCCRAYQRPLIINDRIDICKRVKADGVHLGQGDGLISEARQCLGDAAIIGATCHNSLTLAEKAVRQGATYVAFGRFFHSHSKQHALPAALGLLRQAAGSVSVPKVAIGGINLDNAQSVRAHGADMIAVIHALFSSDDIASTASTFNKLLR